MKVSQISIQFLTNWFLIINTFILFMKVFDGKNDKRPSTISMMRRNTSSLKRGDVAKRLASEQGSRGMLNFSIQYKQATWANYDNLFIIYKQFPKTVTSLLVEDVSLEASVMSCWFIDLKIILRFENNTLNIFTSKQKEETCDLFYIISTNISLVILQGQADHHHFEGWRITCA